jgi:hypothetical protein
MTPRVGFLVGGVQKGGTTALATYLAACPGLRLPLDKEAHVFDMPAFDERWTRAEIDARYAPAFADDATDALHGDATPIYMLHPRLVARVQRYNPAMRWIVLLRAPAERALSQYHMERARGSEAWPLWPALLLERWRLRGHGDDFSDGSPLRHHGYRLRGDYDRQLDALHAHFPREQVLVLRSEDLRRDPAATVARVCAFLGVPPPTGVDYAPVFEGDYLRPTRGGVTERMLRWLFRRERRALQARYGITFS